MAPNKKKYRFRKQPEVLSLDPNEQKVVKKKIKKLKKKEGKIEIDYSGRGVVFIARLPYGFFEPQLKRYFSQFGDVTKVKLCRSHKTARSKGYAFVEFESSISAKVAAETMDNYIVYGKAMRCKFLEHEERHHELFKKCGYKRNPKKKRFLESVQRLKAVQTPEEVKDICIKMKNALDKKLAQLQELGIEYSLEITHDNNNEEDYERNNISIEELSFDAIEKNDDDDNETDDNSYVVEEYDDCKETTIEDEHYFSSEVSITEMSTHDLEIDSEVKDVFKHKQVQKFKKGKKKIISKNLEYDNSSIPLAHDEENLNESFLKKSKNLKRKKLSSAGNNTDISEISFQEKKPLVKTSIKELTNNKKFQKKKKNMKKFLNESNDRIQGQKFVKNTINDESSAGDTAEKHGFSLDSFKQKLNRKQMLRKVIGKKEKPFHSLQNFPKNANTRNFGKLKCKDDPSPAANKAYKKLGKAKHLGDNSTASPILKKKLNKNLTESNK